MTLLIILVVAYFINESIYAAKGMTSPRQYRRNLRAEREQAGGRSGRYGWGDYFRDLSADAAEAATAHRRRVAADKAAGDRPTVGQRAKRLGLLLWRPVGERQERPAPAAAVEEPAVDPWRFSTPVAEPVRQVDPPGSTGRDATSPPDERAIPEDHNDTHSQDGQDGQDDEHRPQAEAADHPDSDEGDDMDGTTSSAGESVGVTTAHEQCKQVALAVAALRERVTVQMAAGLAQVDQLAKTVEALDAAARALEFDAATLDRMAALFEALKTLEDAMRTCAVAVVAGTEAASGAVGAAQAEFAKHLPGVDFAASVGGMAKREAYNNG